MVQSPGPSAELTTVGRDGRGRVTRGNTVGLKHGARSLQIRLAQIEAKRGALDAERAVILADLGGANNVSAIKARLVGRFLETSVIAEWLGGNLLVDGVLTGKGKARAAATLYLQVVDRVHRLSGALDLSRQAKRLDLDTYLRDRYGSQDTPGTAADTQEADANDRPADGKRTAFTASRPGDER